MCTVQQWSRVERTRVSDRRYFRGTVSGRRACDTFETANWKRREHGDTKRDSEIISARENSNTNTKSPEAWSEIKSRC